MVDHLLLYHPAYIALKGFISAGNLGEIYYVHGQRLGGKVRDQENVLWSLAPHDVAMGVDLFGMPDSSVALGWSYLKKHPRIEDVMYLDIYFGQEIRAHFHYSWIDQVRHRYLAVVGSEGTAVFSDTSPKNFKLYMNGDKIEYSLEGEPLQVACQKFIKCIDSGSPPRSNATMGAAVVKILEGAQK
jgi:predicted dehydrogenase